jgi:hypothetical protein
MSIAGCLLTKKAYQRYVQPVIADMQVEYLEAMAAGRTIHAYWIALRAWVLSVPGWVWALFARVLEWYFSV